ncbi:EAL domain-containing protein [Texcoconibacillus texcoconensis]|nr:EAL domain-containing protein [Texcoconibacillus texcoconensis]
MDPLDIVMNQEKVVPFFQPIFNAEQQLIVGYEVLAHFPTKEGMVSLQPFFSDPTVPVEYKWAVTEVVYQKACQKFKSSAQEGLLFLNVSTDVILSLDVHERMIELFQELGGDEFLQHLVLEFSTIFDYDIENIKRLFQYFRSYNIKLAIDDVSYQNSSINRFAFLEPEIIKVNIAVSYDQDVGHYYREVLDTMGLFARKIGSTLMFEGISELSHLHVAWRHGGSLLQGHYLQRPYESFQTPDCQRVKLQEMIGSFIRFEQNKIREQLTLTREFDRRVQKVNQQKLQEDADTLAENLAYQFDPEVFRVYICYSDGYQRSANWIKNNDGKWVADENAKGKNWSFRPFFLKQTLQMEKHRTGILSDLYHDIETNERIRTYSCPIGQGMYVYFDLAAEYVYERDWLL